MSNNRPPLPEAKHDPNAGLQGKWTIEVELPEGFSLIGPASVIAVISDKSDIPLVGDSLVISNVAIGQISETPNLWGWSFDTENGSDQMYWLRGAADRTDGTITYGVHRTVCMPSGNN
jgi:hypothetical protein